MTYSEAQSFSIIYNNNNTCVSLEGMSDFCTASCFIGDVVVVEAVLGARLAVCG